MTTKRTLLLLVIIGLATSHTIGAQRDSSKKAETGAFMGPRFGVTFLSKGVQDELKANDLKVSGVVTQIGWQYEQRFVAGPTSPTFVSEWVALVGGTEQSVFLPSATWLVGVRSAGGAEFGFGPNLSLAVVGMSFGVGYTGHSGDVNLPLNIAVVTGKPGPRVSFLAGFNMWSPEK